MQARAVTIQHNNAMEVSLGVMAELRDFISTIRIALE